MLRCEHLHHVDDILLKSKKPFRIVKLVGPNSQDHRVHGACLRRRVDNNTKRAIECRMRSLVKREEAHNVDDVRRFARFEEIRFRLSRLLLSSLAHLRELRHSLDWTQVFRTSLSRKSQFSSRLLAIDVADLLLFELHKYVAAVAVAGTEKERIHEERPHAFKIDDITVRSDERNEQHEEAVEAERIRRSSARGGEQFSHNIRKSFHRKDQSGSAEPGDRSARKT